MSHRQSFGSSGKTSSEDPGTELVGIYGRQEQVIKAVLVPIWYWWGIAAAMVAIGAARDSHLLVVLATVIPFAVLIMVGLTARMIPQARRRIMVHDAIQPGPRAVIAIGSFIVLVNAVTIAVCAATVSTHVRIPYTIGYSAGAAVLVTIGPLINQYVRRLMTNGVRHQLNEAADEGKR